MTKLNSILIGLLIFSLSGCACWTNEAKKNTVGCIVVHAIVDCTTSSVKDAAISLASIIGSLISGGVPFDQIPWDEIAKQAEAMGVKDGACFLAELKGLLFGKTAASPEYSAKRKAVADALDTFKMKHFGSLDVKIRIIDKASGKTAEL